MGSFHRSAVSFQRSCPGWVVYATTTMAVKRAYTRSSNEGRQNRQDAITFFSRRRVCISVFNFSH